MSNKGQLRAWLSQVRDFESILCQFTGQFVELSHPQGPCPHN